MILSANRFPLRRIMRRAISKSGYRFCVRSRAKFNICRMILSANRFPLRRIMRYRAKGIRLGQSLDRETRNVGGRRPPLDREKAIAARRDQFFQFLFAKPVNEAKAEPHRKASIQPFPASGGGGGSWL